MDIHDRLEAFFDYCHLSKNKVQEEVGLPSGTFSKKPKNGFRTDTIRKIAEKYPQLNTDWLITGKGEMIIDGEQPQATLINAGLRERLAAFIESLGISQNEFARSCGLAQGLVSRITDNAQESTFQKIQSRYPQLNMYWLRTGEGQMLDEQPQAHPDFSTYSERVILSLLTHRSTHFDLDSMLGLTTECETTTIIFDSRKVTRWNMLTGYGLLTCWKVRMITIMF